MKESEKRGSAKINKLLDQNKATGMMVKTQKPSMNSEVDLWYKIYLLVTETSNKTRFAYTVIFSINFLLF